MERISLSLFYDLGHYLGEIIARRRDEPITEDERVDLFLSAFNAEINLRPLFEPPYNLKVSRAATDAFKGALQTLRRDGLAQQNQPFNEANAILAVSSLIRAAEQLATVLLAEWGTIAAYFVPQQGIYQTDALIDQAHLSLPEEVRQKLDNTVLGDVLEAGRCLAFGVPTASGFHMMRAVEAVLWHYCQTVEIEGAEQPRRHLVWGAYTNYLAKSDEPGVKEVDALLAQLKDNHRNLIMHPEITLTPNDAYRLFQEGQSAIVAMADRLPAPEPPQQILGAPAAS